MNSVNTNGSMKTDTAGIKANMSIIGMTENIKENEMKMMTGKY